MVLWVGGRPRRWQTGIHRAGGTLSLFHYFDSDPNASDENERNSNPESDAKAYFESDGVRVRVRVQVC